MKLLKKLAILTLAGTMSVLAVGCSSSTEEKPQVGESVESDDKKDQDQSVKPDNDTEEDALEVKPEEDKPTQPEVKPEVEKPIQPPVKPEVEKPTQPPVKPEVEKPTQPPVKPEVEKPTQPPVKPEVEKPTQPPVKPEVEKPTQPPVVPEPEKPTEPEVSSLTATQVYEATVAGFEPGVNFPNLIEMTGDLFVDTYAIDTSLLESYKVMAPMMSGTITEIGVFQVKNAGDVETVRQAVAKRLENLKNNGSMYPSHVEIVEKGQVVTKGNYVLFAADENVDTIVANFKKSIQ